MSSLFPVRVSDGTASITGPRAVFVHDTLRQAILQVRLKPGERISEHDLAARLGVSRTPVREALQRLAREGLIEVTPQVGTRVSLLDLPQIEHALFVREAIETAALARQTAAWPRDRLDQLETIVGAHERALQDKDVDAVFQMDENFHRQLLAWGVHAGVWPYVSRTREIQGRLRALAQSLPHATSRSVQQHRDIIAALGLGEIAHAVQVMREHIRMNVEFATRLARELPDYFNRTVAP